MNRIERIRSERAQLQAATLAARLRQRLRHDPEATGLRRLLAILEGRPAPSLPLPRLPGVPGGGGVRRTWQAVEKDAAGCGHGWPLGEATAQAVDLPGARPDRRRTGDLKNDQDGRF